MKDAGFPLRKAYAGLLAGLSYNAKPVKVYDLMAPNDAVAPYVIVGPWQPRSDNTKSSFGQKGEINLDVVTRQPGGIPSEKPAADIADLIVDRIKPTPTAETLTVENFNCYLTVIEGMTPLVLPTPTDTLIRKIITVSHSLEQL